MDKVDDDVLRRIADPTIEPFSGGFTPLEMSMARELLALRAQVEVNEAARRVAAFYGDRFGNDYCRPQPCAHEECAALYAYRAALFRQPAAGGET